MTWESGKLQSLLVRYLKTSGPVERQAHEDLGNAIMACVRGRVARRHIGEPEAEDVVLNCVMALLTYVRSIKSSGECAVTNFDGFVYRAAENRINDHIRHMRPERRAIGLKIEHLLNGKMNASGFALWRDATTGEKVAGFDKWVGRSAKRAGASFEDPEARIRFAKRWLGDLAPEDVQLPELVSATLNWHGQPLPFDDLVCEICALLRVEERREVSFDDDGDGRGPAETLADREVDVETAVVEKLGNENLLQRIWDHMSELVRHQAVAICLKFEPDEFMALAAVVGRTHIACALGFDAEDMDSHIAEMPASDARIAEIIGLEPSQIIDARKKGRLRLARRLKKDTFFSDEHQLAILDAT